MSNNIDDFYTKKKKEIDENYKFFKGKLTKLFEEHSNKYTLLKDKKILGIYSLKKNKNILYYTKDGT